MIKIKKGYNVRIISLVVAVLFLFNSTVYGIDISTKSHLRPPLGINEKRAKAVLLYADFLQKVEGKGKKPLNVKEAKKYLDDGRSDTILVLDPTTMETKLEPKKSVDIEKIESGEIEILRLKKGERFEGRRYVLVDTERGGGRNDFREPSEIILSNFKVARDRTHNFGGDETSFGRDGKALNEVVWRALNAAKGDTVHILVIGASVGAEGYDIGFRAAEWLSANMKEGNKKIEIIITDINPDSLAIAKKGVYAESMFYAKTLEGGLDRESILRRREKFFIEEGASYKVDRGKLRKKYGIEFSYQVLDALDRKRIAKLGKEGKFDLVVCRNVHYDSAWNSRITRKSAMQQRQVLDEIVWRNVASVLNDTGFAHMGYSVTRRFMPGLLGEACLKMITKEEMLKEISEIHPVMKRYLKSEFFDKNLYVAAKLALGLKNVVVTSKDERGSPYFSMEFTEFLEDLGDLAPAFGYDSFIFPSLVLFYLDESIDNEEKSFFNYWMESVEKKKGNFSAIIIYLLIEASSLLTEEGLQKFYNKLIELRIERYILEDIETKSMQVAVGTLDAIFQAGKADIPKWLYKKIITLDLTPVGNLDSVRKSI